MAKLSKEEKAFRRKKLKTMQAYDLSLKVLHTKRIIREFLKHYAGYISFSGGKDSRVLLHIIRQMYPDMLAVFANTGLEHPELVEFVKQFENVTIIKPDKHFKQVILEYGYPILSKAISNAIYWARKNRDEGNNTTRLQD